MAGRAGVGLILALLGALISACGSPPEPSVANLSGHGSASVSTTPSATANDQQLLHFTRCLRAHGVHEPDPYQRPGHSGLSIQLPPPGPAADRADAACGYLIRDLKESKQAGAQREISAWMPGLLRYATCMRAHDINMADPTPQGQLNLAPVPGVSSRFGRYSPQFRAADSACRHLLPRAVQDNGSGP